MTKSTIKFHSDKQRAAILGELDRLIIARLHECPRCNCWLAPVMDTRSEYRCGGCRQTSAGTAHGIDEALATTFSPFRITTRSFGRDAYALALENYTQRVARITGYRPRRFWPQIIRALILQTFINS